MIAYDDRGLVPAVAQDAATGHVLMVAWMNAEAFARTLQTGELHFYSRSRATLWRKGETSGNTLRVRELRVDCDGDTVLALVEPAGPACHTGARSCFFRPVDLAGGGAASEAAARAPGDRGPTGDGGPPGSVLDRLARVLADRRDRGSADTSYSKRLMDAGPGAIAAKIVEEAGELVDELAAGDEERLVSETADLWFHCLVGLAARSVDPERVLRELDRRFGTSGIAEKAARAR